MICHLNRYFIVKKGLCLVALTLISCIGTSQNNAFFDIIPDLGGLDNQGQALILLPDTSEIYIMGDLIDTKSSPLDTVIRPYFARFDYEGHMLGMNILYDSLALGPFNLYTRPIIKDGASIFIYIDQSNGFSYHTALLELDSQTGSILRSKPFPQPPTIDSSHTGEWYYQDANKNFITYHFLGAEKRIYIRTIDSLFNVTSGFLVDENNRWNSPRFIEADSDSTFVLVGSSIAPPGGPFPEAKFFFMRISESGEIKSFKLAPGITYKTVGFSAANSYTVLKNQNGEWIISGRITELLDEGSFSYNVIPISFSVSPEFDSLLWISYFSEIPYDSTQFYNLTASCWASDQSGFVVSGWDFALKERNSFLVKISPDGDSLWTRHYIPVGWDQDRLSWADIEDVKATPHNTFVMAGVVFDNELGIRRPWILHVDSMGCLIPGCDRTVSTHELNQASLKDFVIYPNPASDQLFLLYNGSSTSSIPFTLSLIASSGQVLKSSKIYPIQGGQYILSLLNIPAGHYSVVIQNSDQSYIQSEIILKQ